MEAIVVSQDLTAATGGGYLFNTGLSPAAAAAAQGASAAGTLPTAPVEQQVGSSEIAPWGTNNLFPQDVWDEVEKSSIIPAVMEKKVGAWYGGGIRYGFFAGFDDQGEERLEFRQEPEVDLFFKLSRRNRYAYESLQDLAYWAMAFPELCRSIDGKKITALSAQEAMFCRFGAPNGKGQIDKAFISANWRKGVAKGIDTATKVPVLDPYYNVVEALRAAKGDKFIYPLAVPSPGKSIYQLASWNSVRLSGWLDVVAAIPEFKKQLFQNQLSIKYLIEVNREYWDWKYVDWQAKTQEERRKIIAAELKTFTEVMSGTGGAGKSIMTISVIDPHTHKEYSAWKITPIDDKLKDGLYIEDSQEGASHIYTALGFPPTLMGISPGKGMGAGSGSDARVAFNNYVSTSKYFLDLVIEPLEVVRDYNGWSPDLRFFFKNPLIMTLDKGKQVQQETA